MSAGRVAQSSSEFSEDRQQTQVTWYNFWGQPYWDMDQIPARGIEQVKEGYAGFPVKASACVECGVCMERCPFQDRGVSVVVQLIGLTGEALVWYALRR